MRQYSRYQQTPATTQSYFDLKAKEIINTKPLTSSYAKNPQLDLLRLPSLNNNMKRSFSISSTERNTKFKLTNLQEKLQQLLSNVQSTRLQAGQVLNSIKFLKQSLGNVQIARIKEDLKKQARGLQRQFNAVQMADEERTIVIKQDCKRLWNQTEELRQWLYELRIRTDKLNLSMGYQRNQ